MLGLAATWAVVSRGFSCCSALTRWGTEAPAVAAAGLWSTGLIVRGAAVLSGCMACGVCRPGSVPVSPALAGRFHHSGHWGSPKQPFSDRGLVGFFFLFLLKTFVFSTSWFFDFFTFLFIVSGPNPSVYISGSTFPLSTIFSLCG